MRNVMLGSLLLVVAMVAGCEKEYVLTFVNDQTQAVQVEMTTPATGTETLGTLAPFGSVKTKVKIDEDDLPAACSYTAGDQTKSFTLTKEMKSKQWIHIGTDQGPIDKNVTVHRKLETEVKNVPLKQDTVVE